MCRVPPEIILFLALLAAWLEVLQCRPVNWSTDGLWHPLTCQVGRSNDWMPVFFLLTVMFMLWTFALFSFCQPRNKPDFVVIVGKETETLRSLNERFYSSYDVFVAWNGAVSLQCSSTTAIFPQTVLTKGSHQWLHIMWLQSHHPDWRWHSVCLSRRSVSWYRAPRLTLNLASRCWKL